MKIEPRNNFILLETFDLPKEQSKIILPNAPKDTQIYKVVNGGDLVDEGILVYLKNQPRIITQGENRVYLAEVEEIIARVKL